MALRVHVDHDMRHWIVVLNGSNAFNTMQRAVVVCKLAGLGPGLTPFKVTCYGDALPRVLFFELDRGEHCTISCLVGVHQKGGLGQSAFCMSVGTA